MDIGQIELSCHLQRSLCIPLYFIYHTVHITRPSGLREQTRQAGTIRSAFHGSQSLSADLQPAACVATMPGGPSREGVELGCSILVSPFEKYVNGLSIGLDGVLVAAEALLRFAQLSQQFGALPLLLRQVEGRGEVVLSILVGEVRQGALPRQGVVVQCELIAATFTVVVSQRFVIIRLDHLICGCGPPVQPAALQAVCVLANRLRH